MGGKNYYLITSLPPLGKPGEEVPLGYSQLLEHVGPSPKAHEIISLIFLSDDLLQRQGLLSGEISQFQSLVLTDSQMRNEAPLPDFLQAGKEQKTLKPDPADAIWEAYWRHTAKIAAQEPDSLLVKWVGFEVAFRNALAIRRSQALGLQETDYTLAEDLAAENLDFTAVLNEWASAPDPLAGLRVLDKARFDWLDRNDNWFSFSDDELTAYALRLMLLTRWRRITEALENRQSDENSKINSTVMR